ncbi:MAG: hypothetical protein K0M47_00010, partial [Rhizobium sp.]|nr:hypothetical protein [Rhizobium sp.]
LAAFAAALQAVRSPLALACLHVLTTFSGWGLLRLALRVRVLTLEEVWARAHVAVDGPDVLGGVYGVA